MNEIKKTFYFIQIRKAGVSFSNDEPLCICSSLTVIQNVVVSGFLCIPSLVQVLSAFANKQQFKEHHFFSKDCCRVGVEGEGLSLPTRALSHPVNPKH